MPPPERRSRAPRRPAGRSPGATTGARPATSRRWPACRRFEAQRVHMVHDADGQHLRVRADGDEERHVAGECGPSDHRAEPARGAPARLRRPPSQPRGGRAGHPLDQREPHRKRNPSLVGRRPGDPLRLRADQRDVVLPAERRQELGQPYLVALGVRRRCPSRDNENSHPPRFCPVPSSRWVRRQPRSPTCPFTESTQRKVGAVPESAGFTRLGVPGRSWPSFSSVSRRSRRRTRPERSCRAGCGSRRCAAG